ncbi:hypothetical protein NMG60_11016222 [Bertholletia excelsa]
MASSSGNSSGSGSNRLQNSGSDEDLQHLMDQKKRKRMQSNRESARRSRMRRQKHLDDLIAQVSQIREENNRILAGVSLTTQQYLSVEAENSVLRAQLDELTQRLNSLNDILGYMNTPNNSMYEPELLGIPDNFMNNSWNLMYLNQPIMASPDLFQC